LRLTGNFVRNETLLQLDKTNADVVLKAHSLQSTLLTTCETVYQLCEQEKQKIVKSETGQATLSGDFETKDLVVSNTYTKVYYEERTPALVGLNKLKELTNALNQSAVKANVEKWQTVPIRGTVLDESEERVVDALNSYVQIQQFILNNERLLMATK
jgi:hypothetical protein